MDINMYIFFIYFFPIFLQKEDIFFCKNYMLWISNSHLGRSIYSETLKYLLEKVLYFNLYINMETRISSRGRGVCKYWFSEYSKSLKCIQICPKNNIHTIFLRSGYSRVHTRNWPNFFTYLGIWRGCQKWITNWI